MKGSADTAVPASVPTPVLEAEGALTSNGLGSIESETSDESDAFAAFNEQLQNLHSSLPPLTALILFTGHGDPRNMSRLAAKKAKFDRLWRTVKQSDIAQEDRWMEEDDRKLQDEVEKARWGLSFCCVT